MLNSYESNGMPDQPIIDDTFAEAFPMKGTRLIITAVDEELARVAATEFSGNSSSVIGCDCEAGIECYVPESETPDGRLSISIRPITPHARSRSFRYAGSHPSKTTWGLP